MLVMTFTFSITSNPPLAKVRKSKGEMNVSVAKAPVAVTLCIGTPLIGKFTRSVCIPNTRTPPPELKPAGL